MSTTNAYLRDTLRQSLQDVLTDVSIDTDFAFAPAPANNGIIDQPSRHHPQMDFSAHKFPSQFGSTVPRSPYAMTSSPSVRPSAALGISSEELMLAAAAERRMLEEKKMMMELGQARMASAVRQRVLQQAIEGRRQNQNGHHSLLNFINRGYGAPTLPQDFSMLTNKMMVQKRQPVTIHGEALKELGSSLREKSSPYVDVSNAPDPDVNDTRVKRTRGGVTEPFPERLHRLLNEIAKDGNGDVISFLPHGRAFAIHKPDRFVSEIITKYFKQKSLSSFQRQLNLYGFKRVSSGRDAGAYYHDLFLQGRPNMCVLMRRVGLPKGDDRRKMRSKTVQVDPDFYTMSPVVTPRMLNC